MRDFWDWYDSLSGTNGRLRFLIFLIIAGTLQLGLPAIFCLFTSWSYFSLGSMVGVMVFSLLAVSKERRWPNWPRFRYYRRTG